MRVSVHQAAFQHEGLAFQFARFSDQRLQQLVAYAGRAKVARRHKFVDVQVAPAEQILGHAISRTAHDSISQPGCGQATFEIHAHKDQDVRSELARAIVESQWKLLELRASALSLEDIFLKLTTKDLTEEAKN